MSVKKINAVQLTVSQEMAQLLRAVLYRTNWNDFPEAQQLADELTEADLDADEVEIFFDDNSGEFRAA